MSVAVLRVERYCPTCLRDTFHRPWGDGWRCEGCGSIVTSFEPNTESPSSPAVRDGRGESGIGDSQPSRPTTAYATTALAASAFAGGSSTEELQGERLAAFDRNADFARCVCEKAGIELVEGKQQTLVLGESSLSVRVWWDDEERYVVRPYRAECFPGSEVEALLLGQLYASVCAETLLHPDGPELARWKRRALWEAGIVSLPPVALKPLPVGAPLYVREVWAAIGLLVAVRRLIDPDERSLPLTRAFVARWAGCASFARSHSIVSTGDEDDPAVKVARRALGWLDRHSYIRRVGAIDVGKGRPMTMWAVEEELSS